MNPARQPARRRQNAHFFAREPDGSVRLRIRFDEQRASLIEKAAGSTPLLQWIDQAIKDAAEKGVRDLDNQLQAPPPRAS